MAERDYDIVLFGATGFTGGLTAQYLARHAPARLRWAVARRRKAKLAKVREELAAIDPRLEMMDLLVADAAARSSLTGVADGTPTLFSPHCAYPPVVQTPAPAVAYPRRPHSYP